LLEEEIIILIKQNEHSLAIKKYVDNGKFVEAEEFCLNKDKISNTTGSSSLITTLLSIYFEYYAKYMEDAK